MARKKLFEAGIQCDVRHPSAGQGANGDSARSELWISNDGDVLAALKLLQDLELRRPPEVFDRGQDDASERSLQMIMRWLQSRRPPMPSTGNLRTRH